MLNRRQFSKSLAGAGLALLGSRKLHAGAARVFDFGAQIGTLKPGNEADISIFEVREGKFEFEDSDGKSARAGRS